MSRGNLRIFPGAAPGEGKALALLEEGRRLAAGGADVVVGAADVGPETGPGAGGGTGDVRGGLEWCPTPGAVRGTGPTLDVDALLSRSPGVVLVDDLAASDEGVPRWQQIERLLDAGIDVVSTLDISSLASRPEHRALPYSSGPRNSSGAGRERVVVGISGKPDDEALIRRGAQVLAAAAGGELHVVHVRTAGARAVPSGKELDQLRTVTAGVGGVFHAIGGEAIPPALLRFARSVPARQLVLGTSRPLRGGRPRALPLAAGLPGRGGTVAAVVRNAGSLDVHLVAQKAGTAERTRPRPGLGRARQLPAFVLAVGLPPALQFVLEQLPHDQLSTDMLVQLTGVIAVALLGGLWPALVAAVLAGLTVNYFSVRPVGSLTVIDPEHVLALLIFVLVGVAVSLVVDRSARLSKEAWRAGNEASVLGELSRRAVAEGNSIPAFLDQVREHFQVSGAGLWVRQQAGERDGLPARRPEGWVLREYSGAPRPQVPDQTDTAEQLDGDSMLTLTGRELSQDERRLLAAFGAHLLAMIQREELSASQRENLRLAEGNKMRTSILRAVSHDLRTPLAGIKLAASSLRDRTIRFSPAEEEELLATIESGADRLDRLVSNLLDMSRITADAVSPLIRPVHWADAVGEALRGLDSDRLRLLLPDNMPPVDADPGMLERVIANLVENALKYAPDSDVVISGSVGGAGSATIGDTPASELTVVDHGRGIPAEDVLAMFRPFQRADDTNPGTGIGLGLAVAKGFTEAMGGVLLAEPTPGGGLTMVVRLPLSTGAAPARRLEPGSRTEPGKGGTAWRQY